MGRHTYLSDDRPDVELPLQDSPPPTPPAAMGRRTADISLQKSDSETHRWVRTGYVVLQSAGYRVLFLLLILSTRRYLLRVLISLRRALSIAALALAMLPHDAHAHIRLKRTDPGGNAILSATPLDLRFWFTEQLELPVTKVSIVDADGKSIPLGTPFYIDNTQQSIRLQLLATLGKGTYKVSWKTVSLDGHPAQGTFSFRILAANEAIDPEFAAAASAATHDSVVAAQRAAAFERPQDVLDTRSTSPEYVVMRALSFSALILVVGAAILWYLVLVPNRELDPAIARKFAQRLASLASFVTLLYLAASLARLYLQTHLITGNDSPDLADFRTVVLHTNWGVFWRVQMIGAAVAVIALTIARRWKGLGWAMALLSALAMIGGTSLASHAGASSVQRTFGVMNDAVHLLAVSSWLGSLFWLIAVVLPHIRAETEGKSRRAATYVNSFSKLAVKSTVLVLLTGIISSRYRVGSFAALAATGYGEVLLLKLLLVLCVAGTGYYNWRKLRPAVGGEVSSAAIERSAKMELTVAALVIIVTAILVAMPTPGTAGQ